MKRRTIPVMPVLVISRLQFWLELTGPGRVLMRFVS